MNKNNILKKQKSKRKHIPKREFKVGFGLFALIFSCLLVLGSTYAWFVSADAVTNKFAGTHLTAEISEVFTANLQWTPGAKTTKQIRVTNTGGTPILVRLSLYENLLTFQLNQKETGNLASAKTPIVPTVEQKNSATWQSAVDAGGTCSMAGKNYIADKALIADPKTGAGRYQYQGTERDTTPLSYLDLNFSDKLYTTRPTQTTKKYWFYQDGYFYYSQALAPEETSASLLESVSLSVSLPNEYKGALYQLNPYLEAQDITKDVLTVWQVGSSGSLYDILQEQIRD